MSRICRRIIYTAVLLLAGISLRAQNSAYGAYSPYSVYGIGDLAVQGNTFTRGMGGVGVATRNNRYLNLVNPAAITARDTLSFMADMGLESQNKYYKQGDRTSANNTFNVSNLAVSLPIYRKSAISFGLSNFSDVGYDFKNKEVRETGTWTSAASGSGGIYQLSFGAAATFFDHFSIGVQGLYYFGNISKDALYSNSNTSYRTFSNGYTLQLNAMTAKAGVQWEQPLGGGKNLTVGATYRLGTRFKGTVTDYNFASMSSIRDTISYKEYTSGHARLADEIGVGVALRNGDRWMVEVDYLRSGWGSTRMDEAPGFANLGAAKFSATASQSVRAGFEVVPNRNDIRYYLRRCAYRGGVYYDQSYYKLDGKAVSAVGVTFGVTLPVFRWYNGLSLGVDLGQKGGLAGNLTRERYAKFVIGFNLHDIWFQKPRYE